MARPLVLVALLSACAASNWPDLGPEPGGGSGGPLCTPGTAMCPASCAQPHVAGDYQLCTETTDSSYTVVVRYTGPGNLALTGSQVTLDGAPFDPAPVFDVSTNTFAIHATGVMPSKYSFLFRMKDDAGHDVRPLFVPMWVGAGVKYADFTWYDASIYQVFTDRFLDGDPSNNRNNAVGDLARVTDPRSQWQGGDYAGILQKLREGYFDQMGINTLWISSPIVDSHNSQPAVSLSDTQRYSSYHSYHPVATGYTYADHHGYDNPIESAFGTADELKQLVNEAHARGIRVIPDFVANHVHKEGALYREHPEWFSAYNPCDGHWDDARLTCWFTTDMPDFDYGAHPEAITAVVDYALWMIQEFNFDGFRADALKQMDDRFTLALKAAIVSEIETTVKDHSMPLEPTTFYIVGESLGGWARYHVREDMVQGQVDEGLYYNITNALLTYSESLRQLESFAIPNDTAYRTPQPTMGQMGGYKGAIMGNFFGNHDQVRALTQAQRTGGSYERLRLAQTFLFTSPGNVPMLYQGDDIGTVGDVDPDNRKMQRFTNLTSDEQASLANARKVGTLRAQHPALRRGTRSTVYLEDYFWVYKVTDGTDTVYVAINRDNPRQYEPPSGYADALGNCSNGNVPSQVSCVFVKN